MIGNSIENNSNYLKLLNIVFKKDCVFTNSDLISNMLITNHD